MADVSVRAAREGDADEIGRIQVETWRTGYGAILPDSVLQSLTPELAAAAWRDAVLEPPSPRHHVLVAQEQTWTVGFAGFGPAADMIADEATAGDADPAEDTAPAEDAVPEGTVEISPLLVEPRWGRRGHGSRLLAAVVDHARADGMQRAIVWIPEADTASREFYLSAGWAADGLVRALDTGAGELREIRLHVSLAES
jgi:GNAT superfamily N-acetyltransferase